MLIPASEILNTLSTKTANYTLTFSDNTVLFNPTTTDLTATLPTAVGHSGFIYFIKNIGTKNLTVLNPDSSTLIILSPSSGIIIQSDGTSWTLHALNPLNDRNYIINGQFDIWQRGTSFNLASGIQYTADRWKANLDGALTGSVSRQTFTLGQTDVPANPVYFLRVNPTSATGSVNFNMYQIIEGVETLEGKTVTISFYAKADIAGRIIKTEFDQFFGTGGTPSATVASSTKNHTLSTTWQRFTHTVALASISGKTLGTSDDDGLYLLLNLPLNAVFTIDIANVQVEEGFVSTDFKKRHIEEEIGLCARYYQKLVNDVTLPFHSGFNIQSGASSSGVTTRDNMLLPYPMRITPTAIIIGTWATTNTTGQPTFAVGKITLNIVITSSAASQFSAANGTGTGLDLNAEL